MAFYKTLYKQILLNKIDCITYKLNEVLNFNSLVILESLNWVPDKSMVYWILIRYNIFNWVSTFNYFHVKWVIWLLSD